MPSLRKPSEGKKGPSTIPHRVILGIAALVDAAGIAWLLTNDVPKMALRRGLRIDGMMVGLMVAYLVALVAINVIGIVRITRISSDPSAADEARKSRVTQLGEMLLLVGLMAVLVGAFLLAPGTAVWLVILSLVLILLGGVLVAVGLSRTATKFALVRAPRKTTAVPSAPPIA